MKNPQFFWCPNFFRNPKNWCLLHGVLKSHFLVNGYPPRKLTCPLKRGQEISSSNHQFSGDILVFRGIPTLSTSSKQNCFASGPWSLVHVTWKSWLGRKKHLHQEIDCTCPKSFWLPWWFFPMKLLQLHLVKVVFLGWVEIRKWGSKLPKHL